MWGSPSLKGGETDDLLPMNPKRLMCPKADIHYILNPKIITPTKVEVQALDHQGTITLGSFATSSGFNAVFDLGNI